MEETSLENIINWSEENNPMRKVENLWYGGLEELVDRMNLKAYM